MNPLSPLALITTLMCAFAVTKAASIGETKNDCRPRTHVGACPWLPNGGSQKRETCLTATDSRPEFAGQECVWCEKDCQGKHQCEVKSHANPSANFKDCSPAGHEPMLEHVHGYQMEGVRREK